MTQQSNKIKVVCRVRPFLPTEKPDKTVAVEGKKSLLIANLRDSTKQVKFNFDACYPSTSRQSTIFKNDVQPLLDTIFKGLSSTVFCYGVTGAGKTHTIQGTDANPGIIPRALQYIFEKLLGTHTVKVSYYEIYKESVFDLLKPTKDTSGLPIREDAQRRIFVAGLSERSVQTYEQFDQIYRRASSNRKTASTKLNNHSSRSHAILTVQVHSAETRILGRLNLIDLAGSEDNRRTDNQRDRLVESSAINRSLFVLGQVVEALNSGAARIPYRDSKMTRILQDSLGGGSLGMMIVNVAPGQSFLQDTHNTLNFATKSREVVNKPVVNEMEKWSVVDRWQNQRTGMKVKRKRIQEEDREDKEEEEEEPKKRYSDGMVAKPVAKPLKKRSSAPPPSETLENQEIIERVARIEQQLSGSQLDSTKVIDMFTPATKLKTSRGWLRHAKDLETQGELERALVHYEEAQKYAPGLDRLGAHIEKLRQRIRRGKRRSSIKSQGSANMVVEDKKETEMEIEALGIRQVAGRPLNGRPKPLFGEKPANKRVVRLNGSLGAATTKGSVHDRRISFGTCSMNPFAVDGKDFDSELQNQMDETTKPMRTDRLLAKSLVAARLQKKLAEPRTPGDDKEFVMEESDISSEEEEIVAKKKRRLPGSLSVRGLVEQRRRMEESTKKASPPVVEEKLDLDGFNEITLASVLQMINSGEVKKIMKLQGVGKRRAEQIQRSVQEMGPLRKVDELQSRLQFKNKLIKGILSTFA